jgi:L-ascorbate metabolism protein UlaG (beta-lactamase superfamily)
MRALEYSSLAFLLLACAAAPSGCANTSKDVAPSSSAPAAPAAPDSATPAAPAKPGDAAGKGATPPAGARMTDRFPTSQGELVVTPIVHGTVLLEHGGKQIYIDPWSQGKYDGLPKADIIFVTDIHQDHLDTAAIDKVKKDGTVIVGPPAVAEKLPGIVVLKNGESKDLGGLTALAVPMYNKKRGPSEGKLFHDKGRGNGYVLTFGDRKVYLSGDTECVDEMKALKDIDVAFVCMNLPYTMPPAEAAECIKAFRPKVVFPYHYRESNLDELTKALEGEKGIEVRKRAWY